MELILFIKGIFVGFAMAVPIGPIGVICIQNTLTVGRLHGLIVGLGAATADLLFSCVAAFGLTIISNTLNDQKIWIRLVGGAILFFLGIRKFRTHPVNHKIQNNSAGMLKSYISTVFLTLTNPFTIFAFIIVFAALGLANLPNLLSISILVTGVFIGSSLWFLFLSSGVTIFRKRLDVTGMRWVNKIAGILIIISGFIAVGSLL
jgi:threonine/homoserine/homoserine lactone efflux protein